MKIKITRRGGDFSVEVEREPMQEGRFKAACGLAGLSVCVIMAIAAAALCGITGLFLGALATGIVAAVAFIEI